MNRPGLGKESFLDAQKKILMLTMFKRNNGISVKIITAVLRNRKL